MITLQELCQYIKGVLQTDNFADFCINGLQVEGNPGISRIATAVSASLETIQAAAESDVQALIVHHGLFWNKDTHAVTGTKKKKLQLLLQHGISLLAYHLPLDAHQEFGNNWKAARDMGWKDLQPFFISGIPIGVKGKLKKTPVEDFQKSLENYYQHPAYSALGGNPSVQSVALVSGGAHKSIVDAAAAGVDCYVTGSFDEPVWYQPKKKGSIFSQWDILLRKEFGLRH